MMMRLKILETELSQHLVPHLSHFSPCQSRLTVHRPVASPRQPFSVIYPVAHNLFHHLSFERSSVSEYGLAVLFFMILISILSEKKRNSSSRPCGGRT